MQFVNVLVCCHGYKHHQCVRGWQISLTPPSHASMGERVSVTSGTGSRVVTGTAATDRAGDAMLREQGAWDYGPV